MPLLLGIFISCLQSHPPPHVHALTHVINNQPAHTRMLQHATADGDGGGGVDSGGASTRRCFPFHTYVVVVVVVPFQ